MTSPRVVSRKDKQCKLASDPVNRYERLRQVFKKYGGPTSENWISDKNALDYIVMKEAEIEDESDPININARVLIKQHYESEYNDKIGCIKIKQSRSIYFVEFEKETGLADKAFHVMYLSRCI